VRTAEDVDGALSDNVTLIVLVIPPPEIVIMALFVPAVAVAVFTLTVKLLLFDPEVGLTVSQLVFSLTVQEVFEVTASV
jgi:hypothetical protein